MRKILFILFVLLSAHSQAQKKKQPCMPEEGFWVVESNTATPKISTVYFYTSDAVLIYIENVNGKKINVKRKKVKKQLNKVLQQSIIAWKRNPVIRQNDWLVISRL